MFDDIFKIEDEKIIKNLQDILDNKNKIIKELKQKIEELKNGVAYEHLRNEFNEFKHQTIIYLWSEKELKAYDSYCKEHGAENVVVKQYNTGIGLITELNYVNRAGDLMDTWKDITDVSVW